MWGWDACCTKDTKVDRQNWQKWFYCHIMLSYNKRALYLQLHQITTISTQKIQWNRSFVLPTWDIFQMIMMWKKGGKHFLIDITRVGQMKAAQRETYHHVDMMPVIVDNCSRVWGLQYFYRWRSWEVES